MAAVAAPQPTAALREDDRARAPPESSRQAATISRKALSEPGRSSLLAGALQRQGFVSSPDDAAEVEADRIAAQVVAMTDPAPRPRAITAAPVQRAAAPIHRPSVTVAPPAPSASPRAAGGGSPTDAALLPAVRAAASGGAPLSRKTRALLEPRFGADFSAVRIHTGPQASHLAKQLAARAFAYGRHIFFNDGEYQPDTPAGQKLLAHELTHTIQQREVIQRKATVQVRTVPHVQRGVLSAIGGAARAVGGAISDAAGAVVEFVGDVVQVVKDFIADKATIIPGFRLLCLILGRNPINDAAAPGGGRAILQELTGFMPFGDKVLAALTAHGIIDKGGAFIDEQLAAFKRLVSSVTGALGTFFSSLGPRDALNPGGAWDRAKSIFTAPLNELKSFAGGLVSGFVTLVREVILKPLGRWAAANVPKWDLLMAVLGKNPVSDEGESPASAVIGAFMNLIGQGEIWENIQKAKAIPRAWQWFQNALKGAKALVSQIPGLVVSTIKSLTIVDVITIAGAFRKIVGAFGSFVGSLFSWAGGTVLSLLEIILEVVAPAAVPYLKKAGGAFKTIIANPIGFVRTLVAAGKAGFQNFAGNFLTHLKAALIGWLTGSLAGAGVYIPQGFTVLELLKFVLSVLGLTWANLRAKLVRATNETVVKALETGFQIVKTLVTEGPAAAWQEIVKTLTNLKQMAIDAVMDFVKSKIVEIAVTKLLSMLSPAGAFIQALIAIYNTIMFFVERIRQIAQVAASFIDSIAAIAAGNIGPAAARVEKTLAGLLVLVISFLARLAGLGKVSDAVLGLVKKIRDPIDKALDKVVAWIVAQARKLGKMAKEGAAMLVDWWKEKLGFTNKDGESHTLQFIGSDDSAKMGIATTLQPVRTYLDNHPDKGSAEWNTANSIFSAAMQVVYSPALKTQAEKDRRAAIKAQLAKVSAAFAKLAGEPPTDADYGSNTDPTYGNPARVDVIVGTPKTGSITGPWPVNMKGYKEIYDAGLTTATDRWVQMHIISEKIGGQGTNFANLVPAPNSVNTGPFRSLEHAIPPLAKAKSGKIKNRVWVEVSVSGSKTAATGISGKVGLYLWKGKKASPKWLKSETPSFTSTAGIPVPQLGAARKLVVNFTSATEMTRDFGISSAAAALCKQGRPYTSMAQFGSDMLKRGATPGQVAAFISRGAVLNGP